MDFEKIMEKVSAIIGEERAQTIMELGFKAGMEISDQLPSALEGRNTEDLMDIHEIAEKELGAHIDLEPVTLKYPVPVRPRRALGLVPRSGLTVREVAESLGYSHQTHFSRAFRRWTGLSPQAYRETLN